MCTAYSIMRIFSSHSRLISGVCVCQMRRRAEKLRRIQRDEFEMRTKQKERERQSKNIIKTQR